MPDVLDTPTDPRCKYYRPHGAAHSLFSCRDPEVLIEGPAGTGKTRAVLEKVNACLLKYPGARALIVRKSRASMTETVLVTLEAKVVPDNPDAYPDLNNNLRRVRQSYNYPNGSELVVGGMDNADRIMSGEYDLIAAFESTELTEDDWEKLTTRLRNGVMPYQQAVADCNPGAPSHWLNQRAGRPYTVPDGMSGLMPDPHPGQTQMTRLLSRHEDNPYLFDMKLGRWTPAGAVYMSKLEGLTGHRKLRLTKGKWAAAEGLVYAEFDAAVHLIDEMPAGWRSWRMIRSIDFGYTNPFVCQWWVIDPDGRMYMYREMYMSHRLVEDHANGLRDEGGELVSPGIIELSRSEGYEATTADHDAEDRATLDRYGIYTTPAHKEVKQGIEAVIARLRPAGDGRPRLFMLRGALVERDESLAASKRPADTAAEFDGYIYPPGKDGKAADEVPLKVDDHGMDAMRYAVAYADLCGPTEVVSDSVAVVN